MMVTFISQCEKKAHNRTRRVLDSFASRIGNNTWQTVITKQGLQAVKKLLRKTASKNTAVSCHWMRSRSYSELVWVVGNREKFNREGVVPVNTTQKNLLDRHRENDWKYLPLIKALTAMAALLHDWGKASALFQKKLSPNDLKKGDPDKDKDKDKYKGDPVRHEWISCILLNALVQQNGMDSDEGWLNSLVSGEWQDDELMKVLKEQPGLSLHQLPMAAKLVAWLIVSHHRLPLPPGDRQKVREVWQGVESDSINDLLKRVTKEWGYENQYDEKNHQQRLQACFEFPKGLLGQSKKWLKQLKRWAGQLQACHELIETALGDESYRLVLHHSRLCLMLGDHFYSSQNAADNWLDETGLFANTDRKTKQLKQKLDEHLVGVACNALRTTHLLPAFESHPPVCSDLRVLRKPSSQGFQWQDKAVRKIIEWKKLPATASQGFFAVNMASTGCGKTFANAKVMQALSADGASLRYILALGLRTLTLQTGDEYRQRIFQEGDGSELAVLIGSKAISDLHHQKQKDQTPEEDQYGGSESMQSLLAESIEYDCDIPEEGLATVLKKQKDRQFLYAPVLACTIDHLMAATETKRGGRYILPCLRLMSSDLVIDEVDDFTDSDSIAIGRLIYLAGMLGRKVMISSATIPPDFAEGYFNAYKKGWQLFTKNRTNAVNKIGCAWIDEDQTLVETINSIESESAISSYHIAHERFIKSRVTYLQRQIVKRKARIINCPMDDVVEDKETKQQRYFSNINADIVALHQQHHACDKKTGIRVSFGVVRVAHIPLCVALTRHLLQANLPDDTEIKTMAYHSQQVLLLRHQQEAHLDKVLKRKEGKGQEPAAFTEPLIRQHLDSSEAKHLIFVLVASPVEEVGRDHDFDWAIVEPSSFRSIVQLAGRVRRHRLGKVNSPNIGLLQYNWEAYCDGDKPNTKYFRRPGYEEKLQLETHDLIELIDVDGISKRLDAIPRIQKNNKLNPYRSLVDLEHTVIKSELAAYHRSGPESLQGYLAGSWFLSALPQFLHPFRQSEKSINIFLAYKEEQEIYHFVEKDDWGEPVEIETILGIRQVSMTEKEQKNLWMVRSYSRLIKQYAEQYEITKKQASLRFGELNFTERDNEQYEYNDQFGLVKV